MKIKVLTAAQIDTLAQRLPEVPIVSSVTACKTDDSLGQFNGEPDP